MEFGKTKQYEYVRNLWTYPGSKYNAIDLIYPYLKNEKKVMSPFLGGGSLELNLAWRGHEVIGYDYFEDLANLWTQCCLDNKELYRLIHNYRSKIIDTMDFQTYKAWYKAHHRALFKPESPDYQHWQDAPKIERAALFFILLQTSFSAVIETGSPSNAYRSRTSEKNLLKIANFHLTKKNFRFGGHMSFVDSIPLHPDWFIYADPPYWLPGNNHLYGVTDETHNKFPHQLFADTIMQRDRWIISYNDTEQVRALFPGCVIKSVKWMYQMNIGTKKGESSEILIFPPGTKID